MVNLNQGQGQEAQKNLNPSLEAQKNQGVEKIEIENPSPDTDTG